MPVFGAGGYGEEGAVLGFGMGVGFAGGGSVLKAGYQGYRAHMGQEGVLNMGIREAADAAYTAGATGGIRKGARFGVDFLVDEMAPAVRGGMEAGFSKAHAIFLAIGEGDAVKAGLRLARGGGIGALVGIGLGVGYSMMRSNQPL